MRIISGKYRGKKIDIVGVDTTRETQDKIRGAIFNSIYPYMDNKKIGLDLFSGSGNLAIESLSRGAKFAYLVDNNNKAINIIKKNINNIGINNCKVINSNYKEALNYLIDNNIKIDIVFLDPPYKTNYIEESINIIIKNKMLNDKGLIICESDNIDKIVYPEELVCIKDKKYGDKYIIILKIWYNNKRIEGNYE